MPDTVPPVAPPVAEAAEVIVAAAQPSRERYLGVAKRALIDAVLDDDAWDGPTRDALARIAHRLALLFHVEFHAAREGLRDDYVVLNPDQPGEAPLATLPANQSAFLDRLDRVLMAANFSRLTPTEIAPERDERGRVRARVRVPQDAFTDVRFYGRGRRQRSLEIREWFGLKREQVPAVVWDFVVFTAALDPKAPPRALRDTRLRAGGLYLKLFRDIPRADLETLYPNARVVMGMTDTLLIGVPAVVGGVPLLINLLPALSVLLVVVGAYLGVAGTVEDDAMKQAVAALSGLGALGGFLARQWIKYERQRLKHQKQVSDNAYYNTLNNNAGLFDWLIGASEDSEVKEAFLAYALLLRAGGASDMAALDEAVEAWLKERFALDVDFEEDDALAKLERLGLIERSHEGLRAVAPETALARLERAWEAAGEKAFV
ncbi:MAG: TMEM143 family protein [Pseudomonadota bacterium]